MKPINVGLIGIGTVGGGTWTVLNRNAEEITRRAGRPIRITAVADKNVELAKQITGGAARVTDDAFSLVNDPEIDIIVELIGGTTHAYELIKAALNGGDNFEETVRKLGSLSLDAFPSCLPADNA